MGSGGLGKLWDGTAGGLGDAVAEFCALLAGVVFAGDGTVASRPGRTKASVPTLALAFGFAWRAEAAVATCANCAGGFILTRSRLARIWACWACQS
jgi:hypothetical protein